MRRAAKETEEQPHKLLPLYETPTGKNNQSVRVNKPFSYQKIQRIKEDLRDYLEDPEKYIRAFKGVTLLYDLTCLEGCDVYLAKSSCLWRLIGEGNGTPLQYSCLENPMDGGAWQAAVHGVAMSWTD